MATLVRAVSCFPSEAAAEALKAEFYRLPSSAATRTYLNEVLRALMGLPAPLSRKALTTLADDKQLSVRWRRRFEEAAWRLEGDAWRERHQMHHGRGRQSVVERLAAEAIRLRADVLDVEYKDGYEEVFAAQGGVGHGIARFLSLSPEAVTLREELYRIAKRKRRIAVDGSQYELRGNVYESFGEDAFRVQLRRV